MYNMFDDEFADSLSGTIKCHWKVINIIFRRFYIIELQAFFYY